MIICEKVLRPRVVTPSALRLSWSRPATRLARWGICVKEGVSTGGQTRRATVHMHTPGGVRVQYIIWVVVGVEVVVSSRGLFSASLLALLNGVLSAYAYASLVFVIQLIDIPTSHIGFLVNV